MHKQIGATLQLTIIYAFKEIISYDIQMQRGNRKRQTMASLGAKGKRENKKHFRMQLARYTANSACRTRGNKANVSFY